MNESLDYLTTEIGKNYAANASIDQLLELNPGLAAGVRLLIAACQEKHCNSTLYQWDTMRKGSAIQQNESKESVL